jgi:hypothetical protein
MKQPGLLITAVAMGIFSFNRPSSDWERIAGAAVGVVALAIFAMTNLRRRD